MDIASNNKAIMLKVMDRLIQGHELATKLQQLSQLGSGLDPAEDLVAKLLVIFNDTVSALDSIEPIPSSLAVEGSQNASCNNEGKLEDSVKSKRGCYKRKKRADTWTVESTLLEDEFSWRKYGKKEILNAQFPRSYFRCTHKYTQGCKAIKQVQKLELEPKMFSITYIGNHTCSTDEVTTSINPCVHHDEIIIDSEELKSPSFTTPMNEEEHNHHHGSSTESDLLVWQELLGFEEVYGCGGETSAFVDVLDSTDLWSWQRFPDQRK